MDADRPSTPTVTLDDIAPNRHAVLPVAPGVEFAGRRLGFVVVQPEHLEGRRQRRQRQVARSELPKRLVASGPLGPETDPARIEQLGVVLAQLCTPQPLCDVVLERRVTDLEMDGFVVRKEVRGETPFGRGVAVRIGPERVGKLGRPVRPHGLPDALDAVRLAEPGIRVPFVRLIPIGARGGRLAVVAQQDILGHVNVQALDRIETERNVADGPHFADRDRHPLVRDGIDDLREAIDRVTAVKSCHWVPLGVDAQSRFSVPIATPVSGSAASCPAVAAALPRHCDRLEHRSERSGFLSVPGERNPMRHRIFNADGDEDLVFVMGWGNRWTHENVSWLIGQLTDAGYRVHAFELPTNIDDFKADWLEPIAEYVRDLGAYQLLGHSAGALIAQALDGADNHVYLSPWWGYGENFPEPLLDAVSTLPTTFPCLPIGDLDEDALGERTTDHQIETTPSWVSPAFVRETRRAQDELLTIDHDAVVFCSLRDPVVSLRPIGERVPAEHVVLYNGGHELFSSAARDHYVDRLLAALENGSAAVEEREPAPA